MKVINKFICLVMILFFVLAITPLAGFCEEKKDDKDKAIAGISTAGASAGGAATAGISGGTVLIGVAVTAAVVAGAALALGGKGSSTTTVHH